MSIDLKPAIEPDQTLFQTVTRVQLETPFAAQDRTGRQLNQLYLRAALRDSLYRGEAPFASHAIYAQSFVLDDDDPLEREMGIQAGFAWITDVHLMAVYIDRGVSEGMLRGIEMAERYGVRIEERSLPEWARA